MGHVHCKGGKAPPLHFSFTSAASKLNLKPPVSSRLGALGEQEAGGEARVEAGAMFVQLAPDTTIQEYGMVDAPPEVARAQRAPQPSVPATVACSLQQQLKQWPANQPQPAADVTLVLEEARHRWLKCAQVRRRFPCDPRTATTPSLL